MSQAAQHTSPVAYATGLAATGMGQAADGVRGIAIDSAINPNIASIMRQGSLVAQMEEWSGYANRVVLEEQERIARVERMLGAGLECAGMRAAREHLEKELRTAKPQCDGLNNLATRGMDSVAGIVPRTVIGPEWLHWSDLAQDMASAQSAVSACMPATDLVGASHGTTIDSLGGLELGAMFGNQGMLQAQIDEWQRHEREITDRFKAYTRMPDWMLNQMIAGRDGIQQIIDSTQSMLAAAMSLMPDIGIEAMRSTVFDQLSAHGALVDSVAAVGAFGNIDWDAIAARSEHDIGALGSDLYSEDAAANDAEAPSAESEALASAEVAKAFSIMTYKASGRLEEEVLDLKQSIEGLPAKIKGSPAKRITLATAKWFVKPFIFAVMGFNPAPVHRDDAPPELLRVVDRTIIFLRSEPTTRSSVLARLSRGSLLLEHEQQGDWIAVTYADPNHRAVSLSGWVYTPLTKLVDAETLNTLALERISL
jgi:hypothetical protein